MTLRILLDTREPSPHPWTAFWSADVTVVRATLETGDVALAGAEVGAVVERKTVPDFLSVIGRERPRFEKELLRARYVQSFVIVVEGSLPECLFNSRSQLHPSAVIGSVAAWTRRGWPVVFAGNVENAARFAYRYLSQQVSEAERLLAAVNAEQHEVAP